MLFNKGKVELDSQKTRVFKYQDYTIYYEGFVFLLGHKHGEESIKKWIDNFVNEGSFSFEQIYGNFFLIFENKTTEEFYIFSDNSGLYKTYKKNEYIASSFLNLLPYTNVDDAVDWEAIVEFFHFGFSYFDRTFIQTIKELEAKNYYLYSGGRLSRHSKDISAIHQKVTGTINLEEFFSGLTYAVSNEKISLDLTGGFDSRLILSYFYKFKSSFETAISGVKGNKDIQIAATLSRIVKAQFFPTYHTASGVDSENLYAIFEQTDGQMDVIDFHRNNQFFKDRKKRKISLSISGAGGELYKDFWWLQDFPRYNKKSANLEKLYDLRIGSKSFPHHILGEELKKNSVQLKANTLKQLKDFILDTNTQTYDHIYYEYKMKTNAGHYISSSNNYIMAYAPLLEKNVVKVGYQLKRKERFFNFFHKKIITKNAANIAEVRTTEHISCSSKPSSVVLDVFFYGFDKFTRAIKVIVRKLFNVVTFQESPTNQDVVLKMKAHNDFREGLAFLKDKGVLNKTVTIESIPNSMVGRVMTLTYFFKRLEKDKR